ncbi:unnamed protein product [Cyprideis torosa]|uniref:Uncharacterized protein n=1 Tax=Cyprideis torosa TaxID=163714 RepID=A0A7R8WF83_9CRUS|nr:unnamed protein product [Cyprideis torosa]CAG0891184.1 unnamed protein product [Cyprideis torosa]
MSAKPSTPGSPLIPGKGGRICVLPPVQAGQRHAEATLESVGTGPSASVGLPSFLQFPGGPFSSSTPFPAASPTDGSSSPGFSPMASQAKNVAAAAATASSVRRKGSITQGTPCVIVPPDQPARESSPSLPPKEQTSSSGSSPKSSVTQCASVTTSSHVTTTRGTLQPSLTPGPPSTPPSTPRLGHNLPRSPSPTAIMEHLFKPSLSEQSASKTTATVVSATAGHVQPLTMMRQPPTTMGQPPTTKGQCQSPTTMVQNQPSTTIGQTPTTIGQAPTTMGKPMLEQYRQSTMMGQPPTTMDQPPTTVGQCQPPTTIGQYQPSSTIGQYQPPTTMGQYQPPTTIGQYQTPTTMGQYQPPTTMGQYQPSSTTGQYQLPTTMGQYQPPTTMGQYQPPMTMGQYQPTSATGQYQPPTTMGQYQPPTTMGQYQLPSTMGQYQPPMTMGQYQPPTLMGQYQPPTTMGQYQLPMTMGQYQPSSATGQYQPPTTMGQYQPPTTMGQYQPPTTMGQYQPPTTMGQYQPSSATAHHQPPTTMGQYQPLTTVGQYQLPATMGQSEPPPSTMVSQTQPPLSATVKHVQPPTTMGQYQTTSAAQTTVCQGQPPTMGNIQPPTTIEPEQPTQIPPSTIGQPVPLSSTSTEEVKTIESLATSAESAVLPNMEHQQSPKETTDVQPPPTAPPMDQNKPSTEPSPYAPIPSRSTYAPVQSRTSQSSAMSASLDEGKTTMSASSDEGKTAMSASSDEGKTAMSAPSDEGKTKTVETATSEEKKEAQREEHLAPLATPEELSDTMKEDTSASQPDEKDSRIEAPKQKVDIDIAKTSKESSDVPVSPLSLFEESSAKAAALILAPKEPQEEPEKEQPSCSSAAPTIPIFHVRKPLIDYNGSYGSGVPSEAFLKKFDTSDSPSASELLQRCENVQLRDSVPKPGPGSRYSWSGFGTDSATVAAPAESSPHSWKSIKSFSEFRDGTIATSDSRPPPAPVPPPAPAPPAPVPPTPVPPADTCNVSSLKGAYTAIGPRSSASPYQPLPPSTEPPPTTDAYKTGMPKYRPHQPPTTIPKAPASKLVKWPPQAPEAEELVKPPLWTPALDQTREHYPDHSPKSPSAKEIEQPEIKEQLHQIIREIEAEVSSSPAPPSYLNQDTAWGAPGRLSRSFDVRDLPSSGISTSGGMFRVPRFAPEVSSKDKYVWVPTSIPSPPHSKEQPMGSQPPPMGDGLLKFAPGENKENQPAPAQPQGIDSRVNVSEADIDTGEMDHRVGPRRISLEKLFTPAPEGQSVNPRRQGKKMFGSSFFYKEPRNIYPTVEEQVELARKISDSLSSEDNRSSKGHNMFEKRKKRSVKWVTEGPGALEGTWEEYSQNESFYESQSITSESALKRVMKPVSIVTAPQKLDPSYYLNSTLSPDMLDGLVNDLTRSDSKGSMMFAKRKKKSEKWVVENIVEGAPPSPTPPAPVAPPSKPKPALTPNVKVERPGTERGALIAQQDEIIRRRFQVPTVKLRLVKSPWEAALETGSVASAFEVVKSDAPKDLWGSLHHDTAQPMTGPPPPISQLSQPLQMEAKGVAATEPVLSEPLAPGSSSLYHAAPAPFGSNVQPRPFSPRPGPPVKPNPPTPSYLLREQGGRPPSTGVARAQSMRIPRQEPTYKPPSQPAVSAEAPAAVVMRPKKALGADQPATAPPQRHSLADFTNFNIAPRGWGKP